MASAYHILDELTLLDASTIRLFHDAFSDLDR